MINIAITSSDVRELKGTSKTTNKAYHLRIQTAYAYTMSKEGVLSEFPDKFEITLDSEQSPYPRGKYTLAAPSVQVDRNGRLEVRPVLTPVAAK